MRNVQRRVIDASVTDVAVVVDDLADPALSVWPSPHWPRLVLDDGLNPGSRGGHGPIRYQVATYEPGRRLLMIFDPGSGLQGWHELRLDPQPDGRTVMTHTLAARTRGRMRWLWPLAVRSFHEALVHDLFDRAETRVTGDPPRRPARWSAWVRLLRTVLR